MDHAALAALAAAQARQLREQHMAVAFYQDAMQRQTSLMHHSAEHVNARVDAHHHPQADGR